MSINQRNQIIISINNQKTFHKIKHHFLPDIKSLFKTHNRSARSMYYTISFTNNSHHHTNYNLFRGIPIKINTK